MIKLQPIGSYCPGLTLFVTSLEPRITDSEYIPSDNNFPRIAMSGLIPHFSYDIMYPAFPKLA
jgi:hypothetical protein